MTCEKNKLQYLYYQILAKIDPLYWVEFTRTDRHETDRQKHKEIRRFFFFYIAANTLKGLNKGSFVITSYIKLTLT